MGWLDGPFQRSNRQHLAGSKISDWGLFCAQNRSRTGIAALAKCRSRAACAASSNATTVFDGHSPTVTSIARCARSQAAASRGDESKTGGYAAEDGGKQKED